MILPLALGSWADECSAVVPANIDLATQEIVQLADDADERKERTLGVITKPDLVDRGAEDKVKEIQCLAF